MFMDVDATIGLLLFVCCSFIVILSVQIDSFGTMSLYTLSKDVRVYRIRNTKGEDKTEVNGNSLLTNVVPLKIPKLKANPLVHQDETRALLTSETGEQSKGKFQKDWHKDRSRESYINKMDR